MDGWVEHTRSDCPVPLDTLVHVKFRCGETYEGSVAASDWVWDEDGDFTIVAYRIVGA